MTTDYGRLLIQRLDEAEARTVKTLSTSNIALRNTDIAKEKLVKVLPILEKDLKGNQIVLAAIREIYNTLEADGEELSTAISELKETDELLHTAKDSLKLTIDLLEDAGFDFINIKTFSKDEIWLGNHLPTIIRALQVFNLTPMDDGNASLFEQALTSPKLEQERFEDISHTIQRAGRMRELK